MFTCQRIPNLCLAWECRVNSRFLVNAAMGASVKPVKRKKRTDLKHHRREVQLLREKLLRTVKGTSETHAYKRIYPWADSKELAEHLKNTEVCSIDGLIVLNKPYGIAQKKVDSAALKQQTVVSTLNSWSIPAHIPAMNQVLPHLKKLYAADQLEIVKSAERWSSGLMLLSTSPKLTEKVKKCFRKSKAESQPAMTYRAITVGLPVPVNITTKVGIQLEYVHNLGNVPVIVKKFSRNSVESKKVKPAAVEHRALVYNKESDTSLLEVMFNLKLPSQREMLK